jgi:7,8-dihydroneopterin aldolase/epimerase/oxygenase
MGADDDDVDRDDLDDEGEDFDADDEGYQTVVTIEIEGLSLYTNHGVTAAEREIGQRLLVDVTLEVGEVDATVTDLVEDTVDYGQVCTTVSLVAQQRSYRTLERLCTAIADRLLADFTLEAVSVTCSKPEPPIALPVDQVSVTVWREPGD